MKKVVLAVPTIKTPLPATQDAIEASIALIKAAGWTLGIVSEVGNPYISCARSTMLRKAMDAKADVVVFIDHDLSWSPPDLLRLIEADGEVVAGTYRFKHEPEEYMGALQPDIHGYPQVRGDGCVKAHSIPAGFLKITASGVNRFMQAFPNLCYGDRFALSVDLFNHGAHEGRWYGEDYAFARRWNEKCGQIWVIPDLNITHWLGDKPFHGNLDRWLKQQAGGSESDTPDPPEFRKPATLSAVA
jgi:glycosyltransferase involved in cell wall biosynthesis